MKNRKVLKEICSYLRSILFLLFFVLSIIALFIGFYSFSSSMVFRASTEEQLDFYEEVARNVYEQDERSLEKVTDMVSITTTDNSITVTDNFHNGITCGRVVLIVTDNGIVIERHPEYWFSLFMNILFSITFTVTTSILLLFASFYFLRRKSFV